MSRHVTATLAAFKDDMSLRFPDEQIDFAFLLLDTGLAAEDINLLAEATGKGGQIHPCSWFSP